MIRQLRFTLVATSALWLTIGLGHAGAVEPPTPTKTRGCDWQGQGCWRGADYSRMIALFAARPSPAPLPAVSKSTKASPGALAGMHSRF